MRSLAGLGLAMLLGSSGPQLSVATPAAPLARGTAFNGWAHGWTITVSVEGKVCVDRDPGQSCASSYLLAPEALQALALQLERERPWELPRDVGVAIPEGPQRTIDVAVRGQRARVVLLRTPDGVERESLERGASALARAVRVCEAIRALARDSRLQPCVDVP